MGCSSIHIIHLCTPKFNFIDLADSLSYNGLPQEVHHIIMLPMCYFMKKRTILIFCILCLGIFLKAQELKHEVTVTLKLIQVYVMDKAGNPITDLKQNEFLIYDNNKLQNTTDFERHVLFPSKDKIVSHPEKKDITPSSSPDEVMNRKFFLFFDLVNNNTKGFQKAQEAALHFIDNQVQPSDELGVLSYSVLKQLTLHEYLTKDH